MSFLVLVVKERSLIINNTMAAQAPSCASTDGANQDLGEVEAAYKAVNELLANNFTNDSAFMIAYERDLESKRADALINDPLAKFLVGPVDPDTNVSKGAQLSEEFGKRSAAQFGFVGWESFHTQWTACRTKFIDDAIANAVAGEGEPVCKPQFVVRCETKVVVGDYFASHLA